MEIFLIVAPVAGIILLLVGMGLLLSRVLHPEAYQQKITQRGELE